MKIKFSHTYKKLLSNGEPIKSATLLDVMAIQLECRSRAFLDYDTDNGTYPLPKRGIYLMLIFQKDDYNIFTTLRRYIPTKEKYYISKIGHKFDIEITADTDRLKEERE
jgi:hypothetical protein